MATEEDRFAALHKLICVVEPLMPPWCQVEVRPQGIMYVIVHLQGAQNAQGRDVQLRFDDRGLERYLAMGDDSRRVADTRIRSAISERMRPYDDGHAARRGAVLDAYLVDLAGVIASD